VAAAASYPSAPEGVLVAYSGGKDSLAVLELAIEQYGRAKVRPFLMYFIKGLDYTDAMCGWAEQRYGVEVLRVQHWNTAGYLRHGIFCTEHPDVPILKIKHVELHVRAETGLRWIGYGYRKQESLERRGMLSRDWPDGICAKRGAFAPIMDWSTKTTIQFLRHRRIPIPGESSASGRASGIDLSPRTMAWIRATWPADYRRILKVFPNAGYQADRHAIIEAQKERERKARRQLATDRKRAERDALDAGE
jgi:phosphoadenosine phosphosulfate reductase